MEELGRRHVGQVFSEDWMVTFGMSVEVDMYPFACMWIIYYIVLNLIINVKFKLNYLKLKLCILKLLLALCKLSIVLKYPIEGVKKILSMKCCGRRRTRNCNKKYIVNDCDDLCWVFLEGPGYNISSDYCKFSFVFLFGE